LSNEATDPGQSAGLSHFTLTAAQNIMESQLSNERHYSEVFEGGNKIVYAHDLEGNFTFLNQTGAAISGYTREEICRMNIAEVVPAEIAAHLREQIVSSVTRSIGTVYEIDLITRNGSRVPLEVSTTPVLRNGQPIEIQGIAVPSVIRGISS
jgi:two-component system cell cycle sensor histidine kinase/response regulator CckA